MKLIVLKLLRYLNVFPFIALFISFISVFLRRYDYWNHLNRWYLSQLTSSGLFFILIILCFYVVYRYCLYLRVSLIGLACLNLYNIYYKLFNLKNYDTYAAIIIITFFILATILLIKSKSKCTTSKKD